MAGLFARLSELLAKTPLNITESGVATKARRRAQDWRVGIGGTGWGPVPGVSNRVEPPHAHFPQVQAAGKLEYTQSEFRQNR